MGMALKFLTCLVLTVFIVASVDGDNSVDATISCIEVGLELAPCVDYLRNGGEVPSPLCCFGVRRLNSGAQTTPERQQACRCMQSNSKLIPGLNETLAIVLPTKCGVFLPYVISMKTNCDTVK